jgi:hypothetical protein
MGEDISELDLSLGAVGESTFFAPPAGEKSDRIPFCPWQKEGLTNFFLAGKKC